MSNCTARLADGQIELPERRPPGGWSEGQRAEIIERSWGYARRTIDRFEARFSGPDYEGSVAERLCRHAARFDPTLSKLSTWATRNAEGACLDARRASNERRVRPGGRAKVVSLSAWTSGCVPGYVGTGDWRCGADQPREMDRFDRPAWLDIDALHDLAGNVGADARERAVLRGYYAEGLTMKEIGARIGVTESYVSQIHARLIARFREVMGVKVPA